MLFYYIHYTQIISLTDKNQLVLNKVKVVHIYLMNIC